MMTTKFRAWGKFGSEAPNEMIYDWQDSSLLEYVSFSGDGFFEIMQFTGLLDKEGKEIYEGDVVEFYECKQILHREVRREISGAYAVTVPVMNATSGEVGMFLHMIECTVIGNVHENPEFLND